MVYLKLSFLMEGVEMKVSSPSSSSWVWGGVGDLFYSLERMEV
jgi:hypothetical protein